MQMTPAGMSCCEDPACSHALLAAATREATFLTDKEREKILAVLSRDEQLQREQQMRVTHLKAELQNLRRKGALRASADWDAIGPDPDRSCGRCRVELGRVINRGAYCRACRMKVCKGCREYSLRTTDWVCTVCHKHMEIQAASGEWMNEFVRRPSRRRDHRVYVPAADIIKRTIRRSWTISNPTPRWNVLRGSPERRAYSSLPRGQDIEDYPSLAIYQANLKNNPAARRTNSEDVYKETDTPPVDASPAKDEGAKCTANSTPRRQPRVNPLMKLAENKPDNKLGKTLTKRKPQKSDDKLETATGTTCDEPSSLKLSPSALRKSDRSIEKRVSFNSSMTMGKPENILRTQSLNDSASATKERRSTALGSRSLPEQYTRADTTSLFGPQEAGATSTEVHFARGEESAPLELCDIEPLTGTVFRKVTVRQRRQENMRKMPAVDTGWRRTPDADLLDILLPDGDDYKLVFISSDSSSKEEDVDDNDSSSTNSSFLIDECDWDYFEPGAASRPMLNWTSPFGSPHVYRRGLIESPLSSPLAFRRMRESDTGTDEDNVRVDSGSSDSLFLDKNGEELQEVVPSEEVVATQPEQQVVQSEVGGTSKPPCQSCGAPTQYIPIPVPVPIPFPVPALWTMQDASIVLYGPANFEHASSRLRVLPRNLWPFMSQASFLWPFITNSLEVASVPPPTMEDPVVPPPKEPEPKPSSSEFSDSSDTDSEAGDDDQIKPHCRRVYNLNGQASTSEDEGHSSVHEDLSSSSSAENTDSDDEGTVPDKKPKKFSRVFVVNNHSSSDSSDNDTDTELNCTLTKVTPIESDQETSEDPILLVSFKPNTDEEGDASQHDDDAVSGVVPAVAVSESASSEQHAARYTSLVMITQDSGAAVVPPQYHQQVSVVTTDTTTLVPDNDVIVQHTNWQKEAKRHTDSTGTTGGSASNNNDDADDDTSFNAATNNGQESVTVITGGETLSAFEEGLADDDSWVENLSHDDDEDEFATNSPTEEETSSGEEVTLTCSAAIDQEDELRGYHRTAIDFTLHTIIEESCEESEVEQYSATRKDAAPTDLEKYFFFGLGDGSELTSASNREDAFSETSSIYSEGMDSLGGVEESGGIEHNDPAELASSRLEKYFLSGFMGFSGGERRDSDGSVGSDSEGRPSPEQRRKRLVRARGTGRSHSSSLDNLLANPDLSGNDQSELNNSEDSSSSDSETAEEANNFEKSDGQFDTVKRKKNKKQKVNSTSPPNEDVKSLETTEEVNENVEGSDEEGDGQKTPQPELPVCSNLTTTKNQQSRDSGFVGSSDDLLRDQRDHTPELPKLENSSSSSKKPETILEERKSEEKNKSSLPPPNTTLTRKDSFNNWSSDEETNLMMCKMRQFFKTMVASTQTKPTTPTLARFSPKPLPSPRTKRSKPPQLIYFENELTRLMKTVPGIRDDQVREIVEYLSSEDTWSDSYDSSDYTSSDLEGTTTKSALQQQISDSCKQIINKFDTSVDDEGDEGDGGIIDETHGLSRETAFVYQKLVASFGKIAAGDAGEEFEKQTHSPPLIAKVMHHIGSRLVALMHEVSSGESHASNSPKTRHYHRRLQQKMSSASTTTTEDDDSTSDSNLQDLSGTADFEENLSTSTYSHLPRSRSHDLLVGETRLLHQSSSGVSDIAEEREISDCERFSWRGSFESALLATDSRNKLSLLSNETPSSIAAKRRSAGDLLFAQKSLSREQLDRVRSCGSIGGGNSEDKLWVASATRPTRRRSSVPDAASCDSADGEDEDEDIESRSTLPRSLQSGAATTNSLPRLPTNTTTPNSMLKAQSMYHFLPQNAKSARYRPPGFNRLVATAPKRAVSAPGLQPSHQRRGRRSQHVPSDEVSISEAHSSPMLASRNGKSATPSPVAPKSRRDPTSPEWQNNEEDIDRLVVLHQRSSLSSLGLRSDSMASVYSGAGEGRYGTVTVRGQVEFGLQYNYKATSLEILIKQCKDLAPVDAKRNRSDPYVKVYLLPDKSKGGKRKTKVKKHTLNPVFDESLKFHITLNGLETRTLWLTVWHSDMFGRNDFLGEVMMTLENKVFDDPTPKWYNLQERTEPFDEVLSFKGDIIVCLKFVPPDMTVQKKGKRSRGTLHILVKEAKALTAIKANGTSDPFCKSYLLPEKGRSSKQKTSVAKRTINPIWNHTFVYDDVTMQELAERCLELTVWDHDRLASNEFLGGVRFSLGTGKHYGKTVDWMDASGKEMSLWKNMLERPNFWVEGCLALRSSLDARTS